MRRGLRSLGWILAGLAAALLARDLWLLARAGGWAPVGVGPLWAALHPGSLERLRPAVEGGLHPWLWDPAIVTVLALPAFVALGILGGLLLLAGRRRGRRSRRFGG